MGGHGKNESFDDWLARKAEKKDKSRDFPRKQSGLKRTKGLNPFSAKGKKRSAEYKKAREEHYADEHNQVCAICGSRENLSIHHKAKRGTNTANKDTFITLCLAGSYLANLHPELNYAQGCHNFIHSNPKWARENGYLE